MNKKIPVAFIIAVIIIGYNSFSAFSEELNNPFNLLTTPLPFLLSPAQSQSMQLTATPIPSPTPQPTPVPKGVVFYDDFFDTIDFASYAKLSEENVITFPLEYEDINYLESPNYSFRYQKRIYDYLGTTSSKADDYVNYLKEFGFIELRNLNYQKLGDYNKKIYYELTLDIDFKLSNIMYCDEHTDFTLVLVGESKVTYDKIIDQDCIEVRVYSLAMNDVDPKEISSFQQSFKDQIKKEVPKIK